jgi:hypothetical protein
MAQGQWAPSTTLILKKQPNKELIYANRRILSGL